MKCHECNGADLAPAKHDERYPRDGEVFVVKDVPVLQCPLCGSRVLETESVRMVERNVAEQIAARSKK